MLKLLDCDGPLSTPGSIAAVLDPRNFVGSGIPPVDVVYSEDPRLVEINPSGEVDCKIVEAVKEPSVDLGIAIRSAQALNGHVKSNITTSSVVAIIIKRSAAR